MNIAPGQSSSTVASIKVDHLTKEQKKWSNCSIIAQRLSCSQPISVVKLVTHPDKKTEATRRTPTRNSQEEAAVGVYSNGQLIGHILQVFSQSADNSSNRDRNEKNKPNEARKLKGLGDRMKIGNQTKEGVFYSGGGDELASSPTTGDTFHVATMSPPPLSERNCDVDARLLSPGNDLPDANKFLRSASNDESPCKIDVPYRVCNVCGDMQMSSKGSRTFLKWKTDGDKYVFCLTCNQNIPVAMRSIHKETCYISAKNDSHYYGFGCPVQEGDANKLFRMTACQKCAAFAKNEPM